MHGKNTNKKPTGPQDTRYPPASTERSAGPASQTTHTAAFISFPPQAHSRGTAAGSAGCTITRWLLLLPLLLRVWGHCKLHARPGRALGCSTCSLCIHHSNSSSGWCWGGGGCAAAACHSGNLPISWWAVFELNISWADGLAACRGRTLDAAAGGLRLLLCCICSSRCCSCWCSCCGFTAWSLNRPEPKLLAHGVAHDALLVSRAAANTVLGGQKGLTNQH